MAVITAVTVALTVAVVSVISANINTMSRNVKTRVTTSMSLEAVRDETHVARTFAVNAPFNCKLKREPFVTVCKILTFQVFLLENLGQDDGEHYW